MFFFTRDAHVDSASQSSAFAFVPAALPRLRPGRFSTGTNQRDVHSTPMSLRPMIRVPARANVPRNAVAVRMEKKTEFAGKFGVPTEDLEQYEGAAQGPPDVLRVSLAGVQNMEAEEQHVLPEAEQQRTWPARTFADSDKWAGLQRQMRQKGIEQLVLPANAVTGRMQELAPVSRMGDVPVHGSATLALQSTIPVGSGHSWQSFATKDGPWADDLSPLLVFVNGKSGGKQGADILEQLGTVLHHLQVVSLEEESPTAALQWWSSNLSKYRVLICGGDGTVSWVLDTMDALHLDFRPSVAILPLGTGNDLARVLGWGGGFQGGKILPVLRQIAVAKASPLDRWTVAAKRQKISSSSTKSRGQELFKTFSMNNYFGVGLDAAIALDFHQMREQRPRLFFSRIVNKMWYVVHAVNRGPVKALKASWTKRRSRLRKQITIVCDGVPLKLPRNVEGVVILNIGSFAGGSNLWGAGEERPRGDPLEQYSLIDGSPIRKGNDHLIDPDYEPEFAKPSTQDQRLEVVGVTSLRLAGTTMGIWSAKRLAQAHSVRIYNNKDVPMQTDGEPFMMEADGEVDISWKGEASMLACSNEDECDLPWEAIEASHEY